jgi:hypothetical protein
MRLSSPTISGGFGGLEILAKLAVSGANTMEFGRGVGKETDAGKIGYKYKTTGNPGALDIFGAGTTAGSRMVKIWDNATIPGSICDGAGSCKTVTNIINSTSSSNGVSKIIAGTNITISPTAGTGQVTISSTGGSGGGYWSENTAANSLFPTTLTRKVGVGNNAPTTLLDVGSDAYAGPAYLRVNSANDRAAGIQWASAGAPKWYLYKMNDGSGELRFKNATTDVLYLTQTGSALLNANLAVNGVIQGVSQVSVKGTPGDTHEGGEVKLFDPNGSTGWIVDNYRNTTFSYPDNYTDLRFVKDGSVEMIVRNAGGITSGGVTKPFYKVGIGMDPYTLGAKLQVDGWLYLNGRVMTPPGRLGGIETGPVSPPSARGTDVGRIMYEGISTDALDIVGAGTLNHDKDRLVRIYENLIVPGFSSTTNIIGLNLCSAPGTCSPVSSIINNNADKWSDLTSSFPGIKYDGGAVAINGLRANMQQRITELERSTKLLVGHTSSSLVDPNSLPHSSIIEIAAPSNSHAGISFPLGNLPNFLIYTKNSGDMLSVAVDNGIVGQEPDYGTFLDLLTFSSALKNVDFPSTDVTFGKKVLAKDDLCITNGLPGASWKCLSAVFAGGLSDKWASTTAGNGIYYNNGANSKVGVGNNAPTQLLDVGNSADVLGGPSYVRVNAPANRAAGIQWANAGATQWYLYKPNDSSGDLRFNNGTTDTLYLTKTGSTIVNGGLGVVGNASIGSTNYLKFGNEAVANNSSKIGWHLPGSLNDAIDIVGAGTSPNRLVRVWDNLTVNGTTTTNNLTVNNRFYSQFICSLTGNCINVNSITNNSNSDKWATTTTNNGVYYNSGNVGIGTKAPNSILETKSATPVIALNATTNAGFSGLSFQTNAEENGLIKMKTQTGELKIQAGMTSAWGGFQTFYTAGAERMRLTAAGNVGIGTNAPASKLAVAGYGTFSDGVGLGGNSVISGNKTLEFGGSVAGKEPNAGKIGYQSFTTGALDIAGAGTTNTNRKVKIWDNLEVPGQIITPVICSGVGNCINVNQISTTTINNGGNWTETAASNSLYPTTLTRNVGIGTNAPSSVLEVKSATPVININGTTGTSFRGLSFRQDGTEAGVIKMNTNSGELKIQTGMTAGWGGFQTFYTNNAERMRITADGHVGVGTSDPNPAALLDVNGIMWADTVGSETMQTGSLLSGYLRVYGDSPIGGYMFEVNPAGTRMLGVKTDGTVIMNGSGNVGIGTESPSSKLEVVGKVKVTDFQMPGNGASAGKVLTSDDSGNASWMTPISHGSGLPTGTSGQTLRNDGTNWVANSLIFNDGSRVGIGTNAPDGHVKLDVAGALKTSDYIDAASLMAGTIVGTTGNITALAGNIVASAGALTAGKGITAVNDITSSGGKIVSGSTKNVVAGGDNADANLVAEKICHRIAGVDYCTTVKKVVDSISLPPVIDIVKTGGNVTGTINSVNGFNLTAPTPPSPYQCIYDISGTNYNNYSASLGAGSDARCSSNVTFTWNDEAIMYCTGNAKVISGGVRCGSEGNMKRVEESGLYYYNGSNTWEVNCDGTITRTSVVCMASS